MGLESTEMSQASWVVWCRRRGSMWPIGKISMKSKFNLENCAPRITQEDWNWELDTKPKLGALQLLKMWQGLQREERICCQCQSVRVEDTTH